MFSHFLCNPMYSPIIADSSCCVVGKIKICHACVTPVSESCQPSHSTSVSTWFPQRMGMQRICNCYFWSLSCNCSIPTKTAPLSQTSRYKSTPYHVLDANPQSNYIRIIMVTCPYLQCTFRLQQITMKRLDFHKTYTHFRWSIE